MKANVFTPSMSVKLISHEIFQIPSLMRAFDDKFMIETKVSSTLVRLSVLE